MRLMEQAESKDGGKVADVERASNNECYGDKTKEDGVVERSKQQESQMVTRGKGKQLHRMNEGEDALRRRGAGTPKEGLGECHQRPRIRVTGMDTD